MSETPRRFRVYVLNVVVISSALLLIIARRDMTLNIYMLVLFVIAALLSENLAVTLPNGGSTSITYPLLIAAALLLGPLGVSIVAAASGFSLRDIRTRRPAWITIFNVGQIILVMLFSTLAYETSGGLYFTRSSIRSVGLGDIGLPLVLLIFLSTGLNHVLVTVGISLYTRSVFRDVWASSASWLLPMQSVLAVFGIALAYVTAIAPVSFLLIVFPLILARQVYQQYLELRAAYPASTRSLITALEVKDTYTRGHAERVAEYSRALGQYMNLTRPALDRLELAALLHDIGKIAIDREILVKPTALTALERRRIEEHPAIGADILCGVEYLADIVPIVRHHHEKYDGSGYLQGLAGKEIPLESRILAVADSYDAMTSRRAYRLPASHEEAVAEIVRFSGSQFDSAVAAAFVAIAESIVVSRQTDEVDNGGGIVASEA